MPRPARAEPARLAVALVLALAALVAVAGPSRADDLDEAAPLQRALEASRNVLLLAPQAVHQDCVDALRELSSTRESVEFNTRARGAHNLSVARDVLAADYDAAARSCGEDASRACATTGVPAAGAPAANTGRTAGLVQACARMQPLPPS